METIRLSLSSTGGLDLGGKKTIKVYPNNEPKKIHWKIVNQRDISTFLIEAKNGGNPFVEDPIPTNFGNDLILTVAKTNSKLNWDYAIYWNDKNHTTPQKMDPKIAINPGFTIPPIIIIIITSIPVIFFLQFCFKRLNRR